MTKLDELRQIVKEQFDKAETKEQIDCFAAIKQKFDEVQREVSKEQEEIERQNAELIKSYKDLVQHTSFKPEKEPIDTIDHQPVSFEDALNDFLKENK